MSNLSATCHCQSACQLACHKICELILLWEQSAAGPALPEKKVTCQVSDMQPPPRPPNRKATKSPEMAGSMRIRLLPSPRALQALPRQHAEYPSGSYDIDIPALCP